MMVLWIIATTIAYYIKGICGFANTLIMTTILSFGTSNANISPIDLLLCCPMNLILTWENRKYLDSKIYLPLSCLVIAGSIPGAMLLKNVDAGAIKIVFGVVLAALGAEMYFQGQTQNNGRSSKVALALIGVLSGLLCGLFGVGALLGAYVGRVTDNSRSFKANLNAVFIVDNTFRMILYSTLGLLTIDTIKSALLLIPFALIGLFAGIKCSSHMNEKVVRKAIAVVLALSGIALIIKNL
jgi:uncharacterized membrane protein YfcA